MQAILGRGHNKRMYTHLQGFMPRLSSGWRLTADRDRKARAIPVPRDELHLIDLQAQDRVASGHDAAKADLLLGILDESQAGGCTVPPHIQGA